MHNLLLRLQSDMWNLKGCIAISLQERVMLPIQPRLRIKVSTFLRKTGVCFVFLPMIMKLRVWGTPDAGTVFQAKRQSTGESVGMGRSLQPPPLEKGAQTRVPEGRTERLKAVRTATAAVEAAETWPLMKGTWDHLTEAPEVLRRLSVPLESVHGTKWHQSQKQLHHHRVKLGPLCQQGFGVLYIV